jgi:hypothetical protein
MIDARKSTGDAFCACDVGARLLLALGRRVPPLRQTSPRYEQADLRDSSWDHRPEMGPTGLIRDEQKQKQDEPTASGEAPRGT